MTSTFTPNKALEEPGNGDYVNAWSTPMNANFSAIDTALGGTVVINAVGASGTVVLTTAQYRPPIIFITGALTANVTYQLPAGVGGRWSVVNQTTGAYTVTLASAGGGTSVLVPQGYTASLICDGTNVGRPDTTPTAAAGASGLVQVSIGGLLGAYANLNYNGSQMGVGKTNPTRTLDVGGAVGADGGFFGNLTGNASSATTATTATNATHATSADSATTAGSATTATTATYASLVTGTTYATGYLNLPQSAHTVADATDVGKHILTGAGVIVNSGVFNAGDAFLVANSGSANISINAGSGVVFRLAGTTTTGNRTVTGYGLASVLCIGSNTFLISGAGVL